MKRLCLTAMLLLGAFALASHEARAHHGWAWTTGGNIELTGVIRKVDLGYPHGILMVAVNKEIWTVEVGQPWRNESAGLEQGDLKPGVEIRVIGQPAADVTEKRLKAVRFYLGKREFILYEER